MAYLTEPQRVHLQQRIADEQQRTQTRLSGLQRDFEEIVTASADAVRDDEHDPEGATIAFERAQVAQMIQDARTKLAALERAFARLQTADVGFCENCTGPISYDRLQARPATTRCVTCALRDGPLVI